MSDPDAGPPPSQSSQSSQAVAEKAGVLTDILTVYDRYFAASHTMTLQKSDLTPQSDFVRIVHCFAAIFQRHHQTFLQRGEIAKHSRVLLPFKPLCEALKAYIEEFDPELCDHPHMVLPTLSIAAHLAIQQLIQAGTLELELLEGATISARIVKYQNLTSIRAIKASMMNRFVCFRANVVKVGPIRPMILGMFFVCPNCSGEEFVYQLDGRFCEPKSFCYCPKEFRGGPQPDRTRVLSIDSQTVRIQEIIVGAVSETSSSSQPTTNNNQSDSRDNDDDDGDAGSSGSQIPKSFDCELTRDLVDSCLPGDVVTISGIIKSVAVDPALRGGGQTFYRKSRQREHALYLDVHSVSTITNSNQRQSKSKLSYIQFAQPQLDSINELLDYTGQSVFKTLVHSLCPGIYGHELVKAGMILTLMSGNSQRSEAQSRSHSSTDYVATRRSNSHILVVGDPGLGKSQMLKAVNNVSPRGVLVTGNTSSASGLTVTMVRESGISDADYSIEAGALVLGDEGTTCIDEFDKLSANHHASLLEAMEQQTISLTKAATVVTLPARTSIFAAANPVGGHYDRSKTVAENLKMSGPLLSRFDLIFILLDEPNEGRDEALSSHIMQLKRSKRQSKSASLIFVSEVESEEQQQRTQQSQMLSDRPHDPSLASKLLWNNAVDGKLRPMSLTLLRLYIAYARKYCQPMKWTAEAKSCLYHHYLALRKQSLDGVTEHSSPITARQLDSMIRLAEARAKCDLRKLVTDADAKEILALMKESFRQIYSDENDNMKDFRRGNDGVSGVTKSKDLKRLYQILVRRAEERTTESFSRAELRSIAKECGLGSTSAQVDAIIESLNQHNFVLKGAGETYRVQY